MIAVRAAYKDALHVRKNSMGEATDAARHSRDVVYALFGKESPAVFDYGLSTPVEPHSKEEKDATSKGGDAPKA